MNLCVVAMPGSEHCGEQMAAHLGAARCRLESRRFPDGEIYLRLLDEVQGLHVAVVAQLRDPDPQLPGLLFLADALRELGAASVGLVAPYLPYMRQDIRFHPGEAVTSDRSSYWSSSWRADASRISASLKCGRSLRTVDSLGLP